MQVCRSLWRRLLAWSLVAVVVCLQLGSAADSGDGVVHGLAEHQPVERAAAAQAPQPQHQLRAAQAAQPPPARAQTARLPPARAQTGAASDSLQSRLVASRAVALQEFHSITKAYPEPGLLLPAALKHDGPTTEAALHSLFGKCLAREPLRVGSVGGSITAGGGLHGIGDARTYAWRLSSFLERLCPGSAVTTVNGAREGTGSLTTALCLPTILGAEMDVVMLEFSLNDNEQYSLHPRGKVGYANFTSAPYELLLRSALTSFGAPRAPAVYGVHFWGMHFSNVSAQDAHVAAEAHYGVTAISVRDVILPYVAQQRQPYPSKTAVLSDTSHHANQRVHNHVGDLVSLHVLRKFLEWAAPGGGGAALVAAEEAQHAAATAEVQTVEVTEGAATTLAPPDGDAGSGGGSGSAEQQQQQQQGPWLSGHLGMAMSRGALPPPLAPELSRYDLDSGHFRCELTGLPRQGADVTLHEAHGWRRIHFPIHNEQRTHRNVCICATLAEGASALITVDTRQGHVIISSCAHIGSRNEGPSVNVYLLSPTGGAATASQPPQPVRAAQLKLVPAVGWVGEAWRVDPPLPPGRHTLELTPHTVCKLSPPGDTPVEEGETPWVDGEGMPGRDCIAGIYAISTL